MNESIIYCKDCLIPFQFLDIERTKNQTLGIYECPRCKKVIKV